MTDLTYAQLRLSAQSKGIKAATKLRKADLLQHLDVKGSGLLDATTGLPDLRESKSL